MELRREGPDTVLYKEGQAIGRGRLEGGLWLWIDPAWRQRGYGSFLAKGLLRAAGGFDPQTATDFGAEAPRDAAGEALLRKFGFAPGAAGRWRRQRVPDLSAVALCHRMLAAQAKPGGAYLDATCGNGHDTLFLCKLAGPGGRVLGLDIQPRAVEATNARLAAAGCAEVGRAVLGDHAALLDFVAPESQDGIVFNFGWLPGADHAVHSTAGASVQALKAALTALRPGGLLAAVLYSGRVIGSDEKQAALAFFRALPLTQYTVLVCEFANWADTAPLPVFVWKKPAGSR